MLVAAKFKSMNLYLKGNQR